MPVNWTETIDNLFVTTWAYRKEGATEQLFYDTPVINFMRKRENVEAVRGALRLEFGLEYANTSGAVWITRGSTIAVTDNDYLTAGKDEWKYLAVQIVRYMVDEQKNRGKHQAINYVQSKLRSAERELMETLEEALFSNATSTSINGLPDLIKVPDPTNGWAGYSLHGIDQDTHTWFRNQAVQNTDANQLLSDMRSMFYTLKKLKNPSLKSLYLITNADVEEWYETQLAEKYQIVATQLKGDLGAEGPLTYKGRPIISSPSAPADKIYFVNTEYLKLYYDPDYWMEMTEWKPIPNQAGDRLAQIVCTLNLVCTRPAAQGVIYGISL